MRNTLFVFCLSLLSTLAPALAETNPNFIPDATVQKVAEAYAQNAVDMTKSQFGITLDWSDASIADVEKVLALMHSSYIGSKPRPTEEQVMSFAKGYGSYLGEVYRRNHGGEWGLVSLNGQKFPGLKTKSDVNFWPWGRAFNRIMQGSENNVADYYRALIEKSP
jgi:hypothetical protein